MPIRGRDRQTRLAVGGIAHHDDLQGVTTSLILWICWVGNPDVYGRGKVCDRLSRDSGVAYAGAPDVFLHGVEGYVVAGGQSVVN